MILAGDIGGTNARFACYESRERKRLMDFATRDYRSGGDLLTSALAALGRPSVSACCLAVAGPVLDGEARLTNADIAFSLDGVARRVGTRRVALVNDMVGFGSAVATLPDSRFELLGGEAGHGAKGVIAAGTGLGMTVVVNGQCLASEGGHARVAPAGAFERELLAVTEAETEGGVVAWEHYLSGRGIVNLYRAVATVWGVQPAALAAEEITQHGLSDADPVCHTALETWAALLATAAGGLATTALTFGGIFLGGSVALAVADLLRAPLFRRRFREAAWHAGYLGRMPIYLATDPLLGLDGAHVIAERTTSVLA